MHNLDQEIRRLEQLYSREEGSVQLLAVSKRHSSDKIRLAAGAGLQNFGENYLQEALEKIEMLSELSLQWHFIGPIQSNKTRGIAENFQWVHSVDREKIGKRLNEQRPDSLPPLNVCVQVNLSQETSKSGVDLAETAALCQSLETYPRLRLRGIMAIPEPLTEFSQQRACFQQLSELFHSLQADHPHMDTLSMGMSSDFEAAIAEGATMIRLGTAIFGPRD
ncbi:MAG: YggS family pyridoxal phosphate-dependent enzyme [Pseudomonadales bacterium]|nr:YggS family pyridoxal phosphate-dependent enzyme [Pseudomonadales bacterium]